VTDELDTVAKDNTTLRKEVFATVGWRNKETCGHRLLNNGAYRFCRKNYCFWEVGE